MQDMPYQLMGRYVEGEQNHPGVCVTTRLIRSDYEQLHLGGKTEYKHLHDGHGGDLLQAVHVSTRLEVTNMMASMEGVIDTRECPRGASVGGGGTDSEGESRVTSEVKGGPMRVTSGGGGGTVLGVCVKISDASVGRDCVQTRLTCVGGGETEPSSSDYSQARVASMGVGGTVTLAKTVEEVSAEARSSEIVRTKVTSVGGGETSVGDCVQTMITSMGGGYEEPSSYEHVQARVASNGVGETATRVLDVGEAAAEASSSEIVKTKVISVGEGDTVTVRDEYVQTGVTSAGGEGAKSGGYKFASVGDIVWGIENSEWTTKSNVSEKEMTPIRKMLSGRRKKTTSEEKKTTSFVKIDKNFMKVKFLEDVKTDKPRDLENSQKMLRGRPESPLQTSSQEKAHGKGRGGSKKETKTEAKLRVAARKLKLKKITSIFEPVPVGERQETNRENILITLEKSGVSLGGEMCTEHESTNCVSQSQGQGQVGPKRHLGLGEDLDCDWVGGSEEKNALEDLIGSGLGSGEVLTNREEEFENQ